MHALKVFNEIALIESPCNLKWYFLNLFLPFFPLPSGLIESRHRSGSSDHHIGARGSD